MVCIANQTGRDFTLDKYKKLCHTLQANGYVPLTVSNFHKEKLTKRTGPKVKKVIIRHDVDRKISNALCMAKFENEAGIESTYYFRYPYTFRPAIIQQIQGLGHEIGYHYEVLAKAKGDPEKAIHLFKQELHAMREVCDIKTICMHGSPLSRHDNRDLWNHYDFRDFEIYNEAYLSFQDADLRYFTDTGRIWNGKHSLRDVMPGAEATVPTLKTTSDLIDWIGSSAGDDLYLTVHPERWAASEGEWVVGYVKDLIMNTGKIGIRAFRGDSKGFKSF